MAADEQLHDFININFLNTFVGYLTQNKVRDH